jgi:hypothetical protein
LKKCKKFKGVTGKQGMAGGEYGTKIFWDDKNRILCTVIYTKKQQWDGN